jgi:hypothetical protein
MKMQQSKNPSLAFIKNNSDLSITDTPYSNNL